MTVREGHIEWPDLERYSDSPIFNTKAVVQQTGVAAPTLRAWERRYTILSPERANNDYRLYSERDIATIRWLKDRVEAGMAISQAISLLRHLDEEHHQLHQLSENPSSFQVSLPTSAIDEQITGGGERVEGEQAKKDITQLDVEKTLNSYPATHSMQIVQERLLQAFNILDEATANRLMASIMAIYPIEQVCAELITPTLWEVGRLWERGLITVSVEHFASAFFRGLLTNLLHVTPTRSTDPLVIACCAPGEAHELAPLMLSLLLRRSGLRVAYLGQSIETAGLLQTVRQLTPVLLCVSVTLRTYLEALIDLGRKLQEMPSPHPIFAFGGQVFVQHPELILQVPGVYVDGEMQSIVAQLREMALSKA